MVPPQAADWLALSSEPLPVAEAAAWAVVPSCGGVVTFTGTVRDHAEGRIGVTGLVYEAYEEYAEARLGAVAAEVRVRHPGVGRLAILHRVGALEVTDAAVVVVASAPHRDEAFAAARLAIDATKASVPIWKHESWGPSGPAEREGQGPSGPAEREGQGPSGPAEREGQGPSGPAEREGQGPSGLAGWGTGAADLVPPSAVASARP